MQTLPIRMNVETEVYRKMMDGLSANIRVACPGIIQSFDSVKQTATVQLAINERINLNGNLSWEKIPLLVDIPVLFPRAGGYSITFPVQSGNECLVVFSDMCIDAHYQSGGINNIQPDKRRHDLSDGLCFVTGTSQPNSLPSISTNSIQIRNDDNSAIFEINGSTINITGGTVNVNSNGNTTIDSKNFLAHTHGGVATGGGHTGGVV